MWLAVRYLVGASVVCAALAACVHGSPQPSQGPLALAEGASRVSRWSYSWARIDNPERDRSPLTRLILESLRAGKGQVVADIGAGAGYFSFKLARAVGPKGRVYATDVDPDMLAFINREAKRRGTHNLSTIRVNFALETGLGARSVDWILMVNLYLFRSDSRWGPKPTSFTRAYLSECWKALRRGGRMVIASSKVRAPPSEGCADRSTQGCVDMSAAQLAHLAEEFFIVERTVPFTEYHQPALGEKPGYLIVLRKRASPSRRPADGASARPPGNLPPAMSSPVTP